MKPSVLNGIILADLYGGDVLYTGDFTGIIGHREESMQLHSADVVDEDATEQREGSCLELSYLVAATNLTTFNFHLDQLYGNGSAKTLWTFNNASLIGHKQVALIYIPSPKPSGSPYRLALAARSSSPSTFIAVKSVQRLSSGVWRCSKLVPKPPTTTPGPTTTINPKLSLDCTFEQQVSGGQLCNWKQESDNSRTFQVGNAVNTSDSKRMYLPAADHTLKSAQGHFLYQYSADPSIAQEGVITASNPYHTAPVDVCFSFWYYLYSDQMSSFTLEMDNGSSSGRRIIYRGSGGFELKWNQAIFTILSNRSASFSRFVLRSQLTNGKWSTQ